MAGNASVPRLVRGVEDGVGQEARIEVHEGMERVSVYSSERVRFERREIDGRVHANWILDVAIEPLEEARSKLTMNLSYDGGFWSRPLEVVLKRQVDDAVPRLRRLVADA